MLLELGVLEQGYAVTLPFQPCTIAIHKVTVLIY